MVSVIVPTYNRAHVLARAVRSVSSQTYQDFEVVIVDDGSTDDTSGVVNALHDQRIRLLRHASNRGVAAALNTGLEACKGDIVGFLASDDVWKDTMLDAEVGFLDAHPTIGAVFADVEVVEGPEGEPWTTAFTREMRRFSGWLPADARLKSPLIITAREMYVLLLEELPVKPTVLLIRREVLERVGLFDESWRSGEDWEHLLRLSRVSSFGYLDVPLARQYHLSDATHRVFREFDKSHILGRLLSERATIAENDREAQEAVRHGIVRVASDLGAYYKSHGKRRAALRIYARGALATKNPGLAARAILSWMPYHYQERIRGLWPRKR